MTHFNCKATPTINTSYSAAIQKLQSLLTNHMRFISCKIMPLVVNSHGADTYTQTNVHTCLYRLNFKKLGTGWCTPGFQKPCTLW